MAAEMIFLQNRKTMMMKLMQSRLENIMESKVMKKMKQLTSKNIFKMYSRAEKFSTTLVTKFLT